jgi:hypothetical protein
MLVNKEPQQGKTSGKLWDELLGEGWDKAETTKQLKLAGPHDFSCVMAPAPADIARQVQAFEIPSSLTIERENDVHVTALYGLHCDDPRQVIAVLAGVDTINVRLTRLGSFKGDDRDVIYVGVESPDLVELNRRLRTLDHTSTHDNYTPHMTIAYCEPGTGKFFDGDTSFDGREFAVRELTFSAPDGTRSTIKLPVAKGLLEKYSEDQPRDGFGRWTSDGGSTDQGHGNTAGGHKGDVPDLKIATGTAEENLRQAIVGTVTHRDSEKTRTRVKYSITPRSKEFTKQINAINKRLKDPTTPFAEHMQLKNQLEYLKEQRLIEWKSDAQRITEAVKVKIAGDALNRNDALEAIAAYVNGKPPELVTYGRHNMSPTLYGTVERTREFLRKIVNDPHRRYTSLDIREHKDYGFRAYHQKGELHLATWDGAWVVAHEFGHQMEYMDSKRAQAARNYLAERSKGEILESMNRITGKSGYDPSERAWRDKWKEPYTGKHYSSGSTEITSMGLQKLYEDPAGFAKEDPDFFRFTLKQLKGYD